MKICVIVPPGQAPRAGQIVLDGYATRKANKYPYNQTTILDSVCWHKKHMINEIIPSNANQMSEQEPAKPSRRTRKKRSVLPEGSPDVASPCISICEIDKQSGLCSGCYRTLAEIATWSRMPNQQRWDIVQSLRDRRIQFMADND